MEYGADLLSPGDFAVESCSVSVTSQREVPPTAEISVLDQGALLSRQCECRSQRAELKLRDEFQIAVSPLQRLGD